MKKLAFLTALMLIGMNAFSQAVTELRPFWVKQVPQIPVGANYFVNWGVAKAVQRQKPPTWLGQMLCRSLCMNWA